MAFDYAQAKKSGYTDKEIQDYLSSQGTNFDVVGAKKAGYSDNDIHGFLSQAQQSQPQDHGMMYGLLNALFPQNTKAITQLPQDLARKDALRPNAKGNLGQAIINSTQSTGDLAAGTIANPKLWAEDAAWLSPAKYGEMAKSPAVIRALASLVPGAITGGLMSASQDNATPGSIATGAALGGPLARGVGYITHPIEPLINEVDRILGNSAKKIDISKISQMFDQKEMPKFQQQTVGREAQESANGLKANVVSAVDSFRPHIDAQNTATSAMPAVDVNSMELPISQANQLKRNLMANTNYGNMATSNMDNSVRKAYSSTLRQGIQDAEPGIAPYNAASHALYQAPDFLKTMAHLLPGKSGYAAQKVGGFPFKAIQKAIPANGGALRLLFPFLYDQMNGASQ